MEKKTAIAATFVGACRGRPDSELGYSKILRDAICYSKLLAP